MNQRLFIIISQKQATMSNAIEVEEFNFGEGLEM